MARDKPKKKEQEIKPSIEIAISDRREFQATSYSDRSPGPLKKATDNLRSSLEQLSKFNERPQTG